MTNIDTWNPWAVIIFIGVPSLLAIIAIAHSLFLSRYHLEEIKEALKNSQYIYLWGPSLGKRGLIWSFLEISKIAGIVVLPKASIIIGEVNPNDLENFPPHLKRHLTINLKMMATACIWMIVVNILLMLR